MNIYCIKCEKMVHVETYGHIVFARPNGFIPEMEVCDLPLGFAFCAPPEVDPEWDKHLSPPLDDNEGIEPDAEELAVVLDVRVG